jgi:hypothetical protein
LYQHTQSNCLFLPIDLVTNKEIDIETEFLTGAVDLYDLNIIYF